MKKIVKKFSHLCKAVCPDALNPEKIKAVYLKDPKILFVIKGKTPNKVYGDRYNFINMKRFIHPDFKKENKQKLRFINKCYKSIIEEAVKYCGESDKISKALNNIYNSCVDPTKIKEKNKYTEASVKKILP